MSKRVAHFHRTIFIMYKYINLERRKKHFILVGRIVDGFVTLVSGIAIIKYHLKIVLTGNNASMLS